LGHGLRLRVFPGLLVHMKEGTGASLNYYRKKQGFSLAELSLKSGVKLATLSAIERGRIHNPSPQKVHRIAAALEVSSDCLFSEPGATPRLYKGNLKGFVEFKFKTLGLSLVSYTPLMSELFIGKGVLKAKHSLDFQHFPRVSLTFIEVIIGKLQMMEQNKKLFITEGENVSLHSPLEYVLENPYQMKETSFLIVTRPSLINANLSNPATQA